MEKKKKIILIVSISILSLVLISGLIYYFFFYDKYAKNSSAYEQTVADAQLLSESYSFTDAFRKFSDATELDPTRIEAYKGVVEIFNLKNRPEDAQKVVEESARKLSFQDKSTLYTLVGNEYYEQGKYSKAKEMYQSAEGIGVSNQESLLGLAKTDIQLGELEAAKSILKEDFDEPFVYEAKLVYAYILSIKSKEDALAVLKDVDPNEDWTPFYSEFENLLDSLTDDEAFNAAKLSRIFINNGYPYLTISAFEGKDIEEYVEGKYFLGRAYFEYGEYDLALENLQVAATIGGLESDIFWVLAKTYVEQSDMVNAYSAYDNAITYGGENIKEPLVREYLDLLISENQSTKEREVLASVMEIVDWDWLNLYALKMYYILEDTSKVSYYIGRLDESENLNKTDTLEVLYWKGLVSLEAGEKVLTQEYLNDIEKLDALSPYGPLLQTQISLSEGNKVDASVYLDSAMDKDTSSAVTELVQEIRTDSGL